jgi:predicted membrane protein
MIGAVLLGIVVLLILGPPFFFVGPALIPIAILIGIGVLLWRAAGGRPSGGDPGRLVARVVIALLIGIAAVGGFLGVFVLAALGGGTTLAVLAIVAGVALVVAGLAGGARWLIAPALVLALPLGAVAATDLDVRGTWGDRTFHPATATELADGYEMGVGSMKVDMRDVDLPSGRTDLPLEIGMGEIQVLVPEGTCVTTDADVGVGAVNVGNGDQGGIDVDVTDDRYVAPGVPELHVSADVGIGHVVVGDRFLDLDGPGRWRDDFDSLATGTNVAACRGTA